MPKEAKPDPRAAPPALAAVPALVAAGAAHYNEGRFWHAHEEWELAWHGLRAAGRQPEADFLQGLVFVTAAFENLKRGKPSGFHRQLAKALARLDALRGRGAALGLADEAGFEGALHAVRDHAMQRQPGSLAELGLPWPPLACTG